MSRGLGKRAVGGRRRTPSTGQPFADRPLPTDKTASVKNGWPAPRHNRRITAFRLIFLATDVISIIGPASS